MQTLVDIAGGFAGSPHDIGLLRQGPEPGRVWRRGFKVPTTVNDIERNAIDAFRRALPPASVYAWSRRGTEVAAS
jgi:hypothetical protein